MLSITISMEQLQMISEYVSVKKREKTILIIRKKFKMKKCRKMDTDVYSKRSKDDLNEKSC
jgi:hypothetical protein